ncbi:MAG: glycosyltransferase [Gemmatimonadetes bacterium]|nr:glycosyltransferase [Gemmatimonadota bacterium]
MTEPTTAPVTAASPMTAGGSGARAAVSVIVPVTERPHDLAWLYRTFSAEFVEAGRPFEFVFALEPWGRALAEPLDPLMAAGEPVRVIEVGQTVGESALLDAAASVCTSSIVVTLPAYPRVRPGALEELVETLESQEVDMASAVRVSEGSSLVNRVQNRLFHLLLGRMGGGGFRDVASGVRAMRRAIFEDLPLYGDFFRFLPVLAAREGFSVVEHEVEQHPEDQRTRVYRPGVYLRRLIDLLGVFFIVRFTQKPLRFFGLVGSFFALSGGAILTVLLVQRLGGRGIADRPLLLLGTLLLVLGVQAIAMGLIGEIIVHLNASHSRTYRLRKDPSDGD